MANEFVKEFFGGLGSAAGSVVGVAAGTAHATGKLVTGSDLSDVVEAFGETFEASSRALSCPFLKLFHQVVPVTAGFQRVQ